MPRPSRRRLALSRTSLSLRTRPPLERIQQILAILRQNACPTRQSLAADLEVTTKTIQRDIDFLRDRLRVPIEFDRDRGGYVLTGPCDNLPRIDLDASELISIFVAHKALQAYRGTVYEAPLRSAFDKLAASLEGRVSVSFNELDAAISFRQFEARPIELKVFQALATAVQKQKMVEIDYLKLGAKKPRKRCIDPYHLACVHGQWYVIGHDHSSGELRTFHLGRVRSARLMADGFIRDKHFDIQKYLSGSFGIFSGKGSYRVVLHFDEWASRLVRERCWHGSQKLQELTHGGVELTLHLNSLEEIEPWVLSWGAHVRVIGPRELKNRIRKAARALLDFHSDRVQERGLRDHGSGRC
jgi:proteasome accessory factor B